VNEDTLALAFRTGLPFVGLRDHEHDPDLDRLIPPHAASGARAVPVAADDDHVRLVVADPGTDLSGLEPYLSGRQVELALAAREEIDAILGPPPPLAEEPEPVVAEPEPEPLAPSATGAGPEQRTEDEPEPLAPPMAGPGPERLAGEHSPEPLVAEPEPQDGRLAAEPEPDALATAASADPHPVASPGDDPELAGELPSWLEPPRRRRWRVVLAALIVFLVLAAAAVVVLALANA
jgi:type II secretion system (T2SS) protein E